MRILKRILNKSIEDINPVNIEEVENIIKMIDVATDIESVFDICIDLFGSKYVIHSDNLKDIKISKATKNTPDRLIISTYDDLLLVDTTIDINNIVAIDFELKHHV